MNDMERLIRELEAIRGVLEVLTMVQAGQDIDVTKELNKVNAEIHKKEVTTHD